MTQQHLSALQKRILAWLEAEHIRSKGSVAPGNIALVAELFDINKASISRSLKNLEAKGLITVGRTAGGIAEYLVLTRKP